MPSKLEITRYTLDYAYQTMKGHLSKLTLEEALFVPQGGYRSVLGTLKHVAGWSHVYRSYAFDPQPKHWAQLDWPHGLRDTIIKSEPYLRDVIAWFDAAPRDWAKHLAHMSEDQLDELHLLHWGQRVPLYEIVTISASHHLYHAGELNQVLSICAVKRGKRLKKSKRTTFQPSDIESSRHGWTSKTRERKARAKL